MADYSVSITGVRGAQDLLAQRLVVLVSMGGALYRMLHEHGSTGLAQDAIAPGVPSTNLAAVPSGVSVVLLDARFRSSYAPAAGDYTALTTAHDDLVEDALVVDVDADLGTTPTDPIPTIRAWCEALGGEYHDPHQTA